ncbi:MAG: extracellular solute-binding protein, TRAP-type [Candidatus Moranbacteria bacterium GW2011_GWE1_49_15]|nr:MAG: extracellular solute-binding protein, TRAP-type [Candidatus Moranbacteria bacterium GW2011_GWE2_47_10]KKW07354.1 MAG: extracellular solute-binding protein, TRAP-type [Candidatus Moranbacteria bacterium GW2011_GWE1_49_15]HBP00818.1 hypothetical protein [Candidatus Moranbacteria bacterium]
MNRKQTGVIVAVAAILAGGILYFTTFKDSSTKKTKQIQVDTEALSDTPRNTGPVSPISGISCDNWNRRPLAIMQPADASARPLAGLSEADMVVEMPAVYGSITRLMGIYVCGNPEEVGSLRSSRHDYIHLAAGLDAVYVSFGASHFATDILNKGVVDNINGLNAGGRAGNQYFFRKEGDWVKSDDTAYAKFASLLQGAKDFGYRMETNFSGYPHQDDAPMDQRPNGGHLRVGYPGSFAAEYDYDKETNSFVRTWGGTKDSDRNNGQAIAPKNVVVMIAEGAQMEDQYANFQIGDPWFDDSDSGQAFYYLNGQQMTGTWKKDKSSADSKLLFLNNDGKEIVFVPGQIWVDIIDPGINHRWTPAQ